MFKKKDNLLHLCIDYRHLNSVTKVDPVHLPNADDLLSPVTEFKFFSKLNLSKEYCQVTITVIGRLSREQRVAYIAIN